MPEGVTAAAAVLVVGPLIGVLGFYDTGLYAVWAAPREEHLAMVAAHRRGWIALNVGFVIATVTTTVGLGLLTATVGVDPTARTVLALSTGAYAVGGAMWCAVLAIRTRTTPLLASMVAAGQPTEPGESILGAATGALFATFTLLVGAALVGLGVGLALGAVVVAPVAWLVALVGVLVIAWLLRTGDVIPAVVYVPTLLVGVVILLGGVP